MALPWDPTRKRPVAQRPAPLGGGASEGLTGALHSMSVDGARERPSGGLLGSTPHRGLANPMAERSEDGLLGRRMGMATKPKGGLTAALDADIDLPRGGFERTLRRQAHKGLADLAVTPGELSEHAGKLESATYDRALRLIRPEMDRRRSGLVRSLDERGLPIGSDIRTGEMDRLTRAENAQLEELALSSVAAGREEDQRLSRSGWRSRRRCSRTSSASTRLGCSSVSRTGRERRRR